MGEIGSIILMYCKAEAAFEGSNMVFEEVRVFIEVDGFECEFSKTFATVSVGGRMGRYTTSTEFATCPVLCGR